MTTEAPNAVVSDNQFANPAQANLTLSTFAPTVLLSRFASPARVDLVLSTAAPNVVVAYRRDPASSDLSLSTFAPSVSAGTVMAPPAVDLLLSTLAPAAMRTANIFLSPSAADLALTSEAAAVERTDITVQLPADIRNLYQQGTYWAPLGSDGFGGVLYDAPVLILCRWQDVYSLRRGPPGQEQAPEATVYVDRVMLSKGYLALGDHTATADPRTLAGAHEIRFAGVSPAPLADRQLNKVTI